MNHRPIRGMTLIEIVVVIAIISMLMTAVAVYAVGVYEDSQAKKARIDAKQLVNSLDLFRLQRGRYPTAAEGLKALVDARVITRLPKDPWGTPYGYTLDNGAPVVSSLGKDGQPGGTGPAADISSNDEPEQ